MRITRLKLVVLVVMSLFGLGAALEVFFTYYLLGQSLPGCQPGGFLDCSRVLGSTYSKIFGVPLELFAAAYFIINLGLVYLIAFASDRVFQRAINAIFIWRFLGLMIVPYLVFIELVIIHALCIYCTMMHVAIVADFIIISYLLFYKGGIGAQVGFESPAQEPAGANPAGPRAVDQERHRVLTGGEYPKSLPDTVWMGL
jgi:uncharacterized membrane protein